MAFISHFLSPEGEQLPIAAATQYKVAIPAATAEDLQGWALYNGTYLRQIQLDGLTSDTAVHVSCAVDDIFTTHGLYITTDDNLLELQLTSLPEAATVLYLLVHHAVEGGTL